jgi:hypothetical protein
LEKERDVYCVADARIEHLDEVLIISDFVEHDRLQFESPTGFVHHECNGFDVGERCCVFHDVGRLID